MLAVAVYLVFVVLAKLTLVAVAVFVGLVISALLRPLVDLFARALPRGLAVAGALLLTIVAFGGVFTFIADSVAGQSAEAVGAVQRRIDRYRAVSDGGAFPPARSRPDPTGSTGP